MKKRVFTGIKPTGSPHVGNYIGAIKPAIELSRQDEYNAMFFIADYHALTVIKDPKLFNELVYEVAATWISLGLDPKKVVFYKQSDIKEVFELNWILACSTAKGFMNRAHAYKAIVADNQANGVKDLDTGVNMGLYTYPILMAADILLFRSNLVPVGKDQVQHVEIARDIALRFNHEYGDILTIPEYIISEDSSVIPGLDGRKMSKSYQNTIPLFVPENKLKKLIFQIKTDSSAPDEPKELSATIFQLYKEFAPTSDIERMKSSFAEGISWGDAKTELFETMNTFLEKPRQIYNDLMSDKHQIDVLLMEGAETARSISSDLMNKVRKGIGSV